MNNINKKGVVEADRDGEFLSKFRKIISDINIFSELDDGEIDELAKYLTEYSADAGVEITREGDTEGFMCILVKGRLEVLKHMTVQEDSKRLAIIRPGRTIGEMTLLDGLPHSATVVTSGDSVFFILTKNMFDKMNMENMALALKIFRIIAKLVSLRLRQTNGVLVDYVRTDG
jgi:CRP-like cAMP-binding protein